MQIRALSIFMAMLLVANMAVPLMVVGQEKKPYSIEEVEKLVSAGVITDERIIELLYENGVNFYPDDVAVAQLKRAGASDTVIEAVRNAEHPPPPQKAEEKRPFYKNTWFLGAAALVVGGAVALIATSGGDDGKQQQPTPLPGFPGTPPKR